MSIDQWFERGVGSLKHSFRAFRHTNYRLFFFGQGVSLIGTWMQTTALGWMVYRLTGSRALLGLVAFSAQIPGTFLMPFAGALADRMHRRPILVMTQILAMLQAVTLTILVTTGVISVWCTWPIIALACVAGLAVAFDIPVRQSFIVEMVGNRADLPNAIALNSIMFNSARFIGPAIAGVVIHYWGEGPVFACNALSYTAVIAAYFAMKLAPRPEIVRRAARPHIFAEVREGLRYAFAHADIRATLALLAFFSLVVMPYLTIIPAVARDVLHGDATTNGWLLASVGVGAIGGAAFLATRRDTSRFRGMTLAAAAGMGLALVAFSFSTATWLSIALLGVLGFTQMVFSGGSNTLVQTLVHDDKRGRVMGLYGWCFVGVAPFGSLLVGTLSDKSALGITWTLVACGAACLIVIALVARRLLRSRPEAE